MTRIRVFLVDDHLVVREGIRRLLEMDERISVVGEAQSGEEALEQGDACPKDVLLMDVLLPGMDGIEATRQLRSRHPDLKVVVLSSIGDQHLARAIEAGATGYMLKTATRDELIQAVVQAAGGQSPIDPKLMPSLLHHLGELSRGPRAEVLSNRQQEILRLVAGGTRYKDIASHLFLSETTVNREMRTIFDRLGVNDAAHAVSESYKRGIL